MTSSGLPAFALVCSVLPRQRASTTMSSAGLTLVSCQTWSGLRLIYQQSENWRVLRLLDDGESVFSADDQDDSQFSEQGLQMSDRPTRQKDDGHGGVPGLAS